MILELSARYVAFSLCVWYLPTSCFSVSRDVLEGAGFLALCVCLWVAWLQGAALGCKGEGRRATGVQRNGAEWPQQLLKSQQWSLICGRRRVLVFACSLRHPVSHWSSVPASSPTEQPPAGWRTSSSLPLSWEVLCFLTTLSPVLHKEAFYYYFFLCVCSPFLLPGDYIGACAAYIILKRSSSPFPLLNPPFAFNILFLQYLRM